MLKKKICMVGDFAVGKTSLTQKFVNNVFSDKYLTTIGVKIDTVEINDTKLIIWDVAGRDSLSPINASYLVGASGVVLVADGTRPHTLENLNDIWLTVKERTGKVPVVVAINKSDVEGYEVSDEMVEQFRSFGWGVYFTSAKEGLNIPDMFAQLVEELD